MPVKIGFSGTTQFPRPGVFSVRRFCKLKMSKVTEPSFPKFLPVVKKEEESSSISITTDGLKFRVVSYNILAQCFVKSSYFPHSPSPCLRWKARSQATLLTLKSLKADFLCLQELDEYDSFYKGNIERLGYSSIYIQRSGQKRDGCGIFYKCNCAELVLKETIEYNDLVDYVQDGNALSVNKSEDAPVDENTRKDDSPPKKGSRGDPNDPRVRLKRDCVGIMGAFKIKDLHQHLIIVANTHIYWDPEWADVKLAQAKYLLSRLAQFKAVISNKFGCTTSVIVCGDFNSTPGDKVYEYLVSGNSAIIPPKENSEELPIPLCSVYASIGGEPSFTNCTPDFTDTLDYIFISPSGHLKPVSFLELPGPESPDVVGGLPNYHHPSDHLPIGADFEVTRNLKLEPESVATSLNELKLT
ncbi:Endonuclease/exonuclease/phosphatase [Macleaya cordata]|uniref:Endonuclease/exonuclease/phosphatase n=1 Tax=Macleaya cordata TaxID=56857 RepID=A0A200R6T3_MACCD|nr:Endonuclease/exonuclease/phosphatase [Macleaya cordata]